MRSVGEVVMKDIGDGGLAMVVVVVVESLTTPKGNTVGVVRGGGCCCGEGEEVWRGECVEKGVLHRWGSV